MYTGRPTTWQGKIALPYPSDYGYAADFSKCAKMLDDYNNRACTLNNWMNTIIAPNEGWLLTPDSGDSGRVWIVALSGYVHSNIYASNAYGVAPVLYLNANANIKSGTGSSSEPYQLLVN